MKVLLTRTDVVLASIGVWLLGPILLGTYRWWLLMRGAGLSCGFWRAVHLQLVGFFFNTAMPGAVGGDIVKAIYIVRDQEKSTGKTPAMLSVLLDRIVGLIGLFIMGATASLLHLEVLSQNVITKNLLGALAFTVFLSLVFLGMVFIPYRDGKDPIARILSRDWPAFSVIRGIYQALRTYRHRPGIIFGTILISVAIQIIFLGYMTFVGTVLYGSEVFRFELLALVFPFGILVTAVPLAPGGLGVGHAAFDKLFSLVGLPGGANVFNSYAVSQLALNLLGIIPYLGLKGRSNLREAVLEAEPALNAKS